MTTEFGKELRKIRVDYNDNLTQMANKARLSVSYLSAIENGVRSIPNDLVDKIADIYKLDNKRRGLLRKLAAASSTKIDIDLSNVSSKQKELIFALSREIKDIDDDQCLSILNKIKGS